MANQDIRTNTHLQPGQFYGHSVRKQQVCGVILSELVHAEGKLIPTHSHEMAFFSLLLAGDYREFFRSKTISYRPLTICWHPPDLTHRDEIGREGGKFFTIEVQHAWLERLREFARVPDALHDVRGGELVWLALRLYREHNEAQLAAPLMIEGLLLEMLAIASRLRLPQEKRAPLWLARVLDRLHAEFQQNLTSNELAREAGVHAVHLAAVFRQFQGQPLGEYQQQLRVQYASQLLGKQELSLAEIAQAAGFADQSHLTRTIKRHSGLTPGALRSLLLTQQSGRPH